MYLVIWNQDRLRKVAFSANHFMSTVLHPTLSIMKKTGKEKLKKGSLDEVKKRMKLLSWESGDKKIDDESNPKN